MKNWKTELADGRTILAIWQQIPAPMVSRFLASMGWDWIILDMQHGSFNWTLAYECIHIIRTGGARPLVRVGIGQDFEVQKALDLGAGGVIVPLVNSHEEAVRMANAAKYPPQGERSIGGDLRYHYGGDYVATANDGTLLLVQIEHIRAVQNVEAILGVPGVDGCFVGPTDLAASMGLPLKGFDGIPEHRAAMERIVRTCNGLGKLACTNTYNLQEAKEQAANGYRAISLRSDGDLFMDSGRTLLGSLRSGTAG
jgi:2-keto-3-deoxy-L-rhamnonate aldolase RhmA